MNRSVDSPEPTSAASTADGPGTTSTRAPRGDRRGDRVRPRIGHARHPGLADHRHPLAGAQHTGDLVGALGLVALEVRDHPARGVARPQRVDVGEQEPRGTRVLGRDEIRLAQDARRAQRQVLEVADRRADDEQGADHDCSSLRQDGAGSQHRGAMFPNTPDTGYRAKNIAES